MQPELVYIQKGYGYTSKSSNTSGGTTSTYNSNVSLAFNYFEIPVSAKLMFGSEKFKFHVLAGPSIGFLLGGKLKSEYTSTGTTTTSAKQEQDIDPNSATYKDQLAKTDFGAHIGAGAGMQVGAGKVFLDARYQFGFTDIITDTGDQQKWFNRGLGVSVGYLHPITQK